MARHILFAMTFWHLLGAPASGAPDAMTLALQALGAGTAEEQKRRIFGAPTVVLGPEFRARAVGELPAEVRQHRVTEGKLLRRVERVIEPVLRLHRREAEVEMILFRDRIPQAMLWKGCLLLLSDGLAGALHDTELAGIVAHELSHLYFMDEMLVAQKARDATLMRVVELKCDAAAVLSMRLLGSDPTLYVRAIKKIEQVTKGMSLSRGLQQTHPKVHERALFLQRFIKQLE